MSVSSIAIFCVIAVLCAGTVVAVVVNRMVDTRVRQLAGTIPKCRCERCRHLHNVEEATNDPYNTCYCSLLGVYMKPYNYCSYASKGE